MSHECQRCGHALVGSVSIAAGMGPVCRQKDMLERQFDFFDKNPDFSDHPCRCSGRGRHRRTLPQHPGKCSEEQAQCRAEGCSGVMAVDHFRMTWRKLNRVSGIGERA